MGEDVEDGVGEGHFGFVVVWGVRNGLEDDGGFRWEKYRETPVLLIYVSSVDTPYSQEHTCMCRVYAGTQCELTQMRIG